jgi:hypothetical protein
MVNFRLTTTNGGITAALQLQQDQEQRAAVSTAARNDAGVGREPKTSKPKSRGKGTKNPTLKKILRSYGKVSTLPAFPVPSKPGASSNTHPGKPEPAGAAAPAPARSGIPTTLNTVSKQASTAELTKPPFKSLEVRVTTPLGPDDAQAQPRAKNQPKTTQRVAYRGGSGENTRTLNDQRPNGRQA